MLSNYFKIAWRNLVRNKAYASINVLGLALSLTCGILIFTLVNYHYSVDRFHANADRIYRVVMEAHHEGIDYSSGVYSPLGRVIRDEQTFAEKTARVLSVNGAVLTVPTNGKIDKYRSDIVFAESDFFSILDFPLVQGNAQTALNAPNTALLTERMAQKFFGTANPMGKTFRFDNRMDFTVTGVLKNKPANTDRQEEIYLSFSNAKQYDDEYFNEQNWGNYSGAMQVFTLLKPTATVQTAESALASVMKKYVTDDSNKNSVLKLQPLADIHLNTDYSGRIDKTNLLVLSLIGFLLIVVACVNFINLATAQALKRAKEIGVRKVLGSRPVQLFWQFMAETSLISGLATLLALVAAWLTLPLLSQLLQTQLSINLFGNPTLLLFLALSAVLVTFLSGAYPGLVLAGFRPVLALSGRLSQRHIGGFPLRRVLVVGQLALSQLLIIGTIVITNQMRYARQADLGFAKEGVIMMPLPVQDNAKMSTLKSRFLQLPGVENVSFCYQAPADQGINSTTVRFGGRAEDENFLIVTKDADEEYVPTFKLSMLAGRNIIHSDTTNEYVLNEAALKALNLKSPQEAVGQMLYTSKGSRKGPIVGVMKDFHNGSFRQSIPPICIRANTGAYISCGGADKPKFNPELSASTGKNLDGYLPGIYLRVPVSG